MIPRFPLISIESANEHMRLPCENDQLLRDKIIIASGIVWRHMKLEAIPEEWIVSDESPLPEIDYTAGPTMKVKPTKDVSIVELYQESPTILIRVPGNVQAAVLLVLAELFENRQASTSDPLSDAVLSLLESYRDPTFS